MSTVSAPRTINCTQCAAPLDLRAGHRVKSLTCGFCGAVLDSKDEYRAVSQFKNVKRPAMPLKLGMQGKIKGVEFTIIGVVQFRDDEGYQWLEYQLFSPTHGYHWLVSSQGHFVFSRRVRELPRISNVQKSKFKAKGMTFKVYESYTAAIIFVEGELSYVARVGDKTSVTEGICPPYNFARERNAGEQEYVFGEYINAAQIYAAFKVSKPYPKANTIHAIQPYVAKESALSLSRIGRWFAAPALLVALGIFIFGSGARVLNETFSAAQITKGVHSTPFTVTGSNSMMGLQLASQQSNAWAWYDITLLKGEESIAQLSKQLSYYSGVEGGESWSEGSQSERAYFKLDEPGSYRFFVKAIGGTGNRQGPLQNRPLAMTLDEGVIVSRYFFVLALLCVLCAIVEPLLRYRFEHKRWAAVLEDDDDE
jgi:hypothetical protein